MKKLLLAMFLIPGICKAQTKGTSTIRGVVTFFFNKYQGDKPDIGAEVFALDSSAANKFNPSTVDSFHYASVYRGISASYKNMNSPVPSQVQDELKKYNAEDEQYFKALDLRDYEQFLRVSQAEEVYQAVVDGTGSYSISLPPGAYYVFIKSHGRTSMSVSEYKGMLAFKKIKVKADQSINFSTKFDLY